jgi:hypothetical protein
VPVATAARGLHADVRDAEETLQRTLVTTTCWTLANDIVVS